MDDGDDTGHASKVFSQLQLLLVPLVAGDDRPADFHNEEALL